MTEAKHTAGQGQAKNTDVELWRRKPDDYYSPSIHVTANRDIGINVGGVVFVMSVEKWHGYQAEINRLEAEKAELVEACKFFVTALETGLLVRDITKDGEPDWALKMMDFVKQLQKAQAAIAAAEKSNTEQGVEK